MDIADHASYQLATGMDIGGMIACPIQLEGIGRQSQAQSAQRTSSSKRLCLRFDRGWSRSRRRACAKRWARSAVPTSG